MNPKAFEKSASGNIRKIGDGDDQYWAFLPNPLPPQLDLNLDLVALLSEADRALGELAGLGRNLPNAGLLIRPFSRREAVLSSRIEGTRTDLRGLFEFEVEEATRSGGNINDRRHTDAREVHNYVRAMEYGMERLKTFPMSLRLLREMHERLMSGVRGEDKRPGEFRTSQNWIGQTMNLAEARFVPPPPEYLQEMLGAFEKYLHSKDKLPPLIRLALIHYQFEALHPFLDGNGRIGRLLISLLLVHWGLLPAPLLYLSAWFERRRDQYYDLLLAVSRRSAWAEWLAYFVEGVKNEAINAKEKSAELLALQNKWRAYVGIKGTAKMLTVVDMLLEQPVVAGVQVQRRLKCTHPTAMSTLRRLVKAKIVREYAPIGSAQKIFVATDILGIVDR